MMVSVVFTVTIVKVFDIVNIVYIVYIFNIVVLVIVNIYCVNIWYFWEKTYTNKALSCSYVVAQLDFYFNIKRLETCSHMPALSVVL